MDELVDSGTDTPVWQRYRLKIMSLSQQVSEVKNMIHTRCISFLSGFV